MSDIYTPRVSFMSATVMPPKPAEKQQSEPLPTQTQLGILMLAEARKAMKVSTNKDGKPYRHPSKAVAAQVKRKRMAILAYVAKNPGERAFQISGGTGQNYCSSNKYVDNLYNDGHLSAMGPLHARVFTITPRGEQWLEENQ